MHDLGDVRGVFGAVAVWAFLAERGGEFNGTSTEFRPLIRFGNQLHGRRRLAELAEAHGGGEVGPGIQDQ